MKRALLVTAGTVVGLSATLAYTPRPMTPAAETADTVTSAEAAAPAQATAPTYPPSPAAQGSTAPTPTAATVPTTHVGPVAATRFGDVQVQISVAAGRVVDVVALAFPAADSRSAAISTSAIPILRSETLAVVAADDVATVSGATYTSEAWRTSLAGALAEAGL
jgi:uncharacterized protein with FMN-binding domain